MIINKEWEIEYSEEFNTSICEFAIKVGEEIKQLGPMERFYAMKLISEKLENLTSIYVMVGSLAMQEISHSDSKTGI